VEHELGGRVRVVKGERRVEEHKGKSVMVEGEDVHIETYIRFIQVQIWLKIPKIIEKKKAIDSYIYIFFFG
jgi:hypothetical protein